MRTSVSERDIAYGSASGDCRAHVTDAQSYPPLVSAASLASRIIRWEERARSLLPPKNTAGSRDGNFLHHDHLQTSSQVPDSSSDPSV